MRLEHLFSFEATLKAGQPVGQGPFGNRQIFEITGGSFEGPRLRGEVLTCGGDWILIDATGIGRLDVRLTLRTGDGAHIYCQYTGVLEMNQAVATALASGGGTNYGDSYFMTQPRFETGDIRYAWLNSLVCVGEGHMVPGGVGYKVYACQPD